MMLCYFSVFVGKQDSVIIEGRENVDVDSSQLLKQVDKWERRIEELTVIRHFHIEVLDSLLRHEAPSCFAALSLLFHRVPLLVRYLMLQQSLKSCRPSSAIFFLLRIEHGITIEETSHGISSTRITLANMISKHRSNHPSDLMIHTVGQNLTRQLKH